MKRIYTAFFLALMLLLSGCTGTVGMQTGVVSPTTAAVTATQALPATTGSATGSPATTSAATTKQTAVTTMNQTSTNQTTTTMSAEELRAREIDTQLASMTTRQKVGQLFVAAVTGTTIPDDERAVLEGCAIGNVILFRNNVGTLEELAALNRDIRKTIQDSAGVAPFISVDQEGGIVERIKAAATAPKAAIIGSTGEPALARRLGELQGAQLCALGINLNFAPVADVNTNPDNPVIGSRSYGTDPETVSAFVTAYSEGLMRAGVLACVKHFPGHGDTSVDSHYGLPKVSYERDRLDAIELVPFKASIAQGVSMVMVGHILYPALGAVDVPTSLSREVITGLLREELGYDGLVITDSLVMGAITESRSPAQACVQALNAGADLLCVPVVGEALQEAYDAVLSAVENGEVSLTRLDEAVRRILTAKDAFGVAEAQDATGDVPEQDAYAQLLEEIARKAE